MKVVLDITNVPAAALQVARQHAERLADQRHAFARESADGYEVVTSNGNNWLLTDTTLVYRGARCALWDRNNVVGSFLAGLRGLPDYWEENGHPHLGVRLEDLPILETHTTDPTRDWLGRSTLIAREGDEDMFISFTGGSAPRERAVRRFKERRAA